MPSHRQRATITTGWWLNMADETLERITILLQARDRDLQRAIDRNTREVRRFARDASRETKTMAKEIDSHVAQVGKSVMGLGRSFALGLGAGVVTAAFAGVSTNLAGMVRGIAEVGDEAKRAGLGVEAFQEWKFVAEQNRISVDALVDGFKELSLRVDEFVQTGVGPAAESISRLGYTATELKAKLKDPSALMLEILGRMQAMDKAAQIRIADEMFGGAGGERFVELLSLGEDGLRRTIDRAHEVGAVLDQEMIQKAAEIDQKFNELSARIGNTLKGLVVDMASAVEQGISAIDRLSEVSTVLDEAERLTGISGLEDALQGEGEAVATILEEIVVLQREHERLGENASIAARQIMAVVEQMDAMEVAPDVATDLDVIVDRLMSLAQQAALGQIEADDLRAELVSAGSQAEAALSSIGAINGIDLSGAVSAVGVLIGALQAAATAAANVRAAIPRGAVSDPHKAGSQHPPVLGTQNAPVSSPRPKSAPLDIDFGLPDTGGSKGGAGGGGGASGYLRAVEDIKERTAALEAEAAAFLEVAGSNAHYADAAEYAKTRARLLADAMADGKKLTPELRAEIDRLAAAYMEASHSAEMAGLKLDEMRDRAKRGADAVTDIFMAIGEGSGAAKRAIASLLIEMARVQAQKAFMSLATASGGGGLFSFLGGLLGGARASGGAVSAGVPYLVNENTPNSEVFVPSTSGGILNVPQAQAALRDVGGKANAVVRVLIEEAPGFASRVRTEAQGVAVQVVQAYDAQALPQRVQQISSDPRGRG